MRHLFLVVLILGTSNAIARQNMQTSANTISTLTTSTEQFYYGNQNEPPRAIEFKERTITSGFFIANIQQYLGIPSEYSFVEVESNTDQLGMRHHLLQQYYKGILIEGMNYRVHEKEGFVTSANGRAVRSTNFDNLNLRPSIDEQTAFQLAVKYVGAKDSTYTAGQPLIVSKGFRYTAESFFLAYQFDVNVSLIEKWRISIDANNGQLINKVSLVYSCHGEVPPLPYTKGNGLTNYYGRRSIRVEESGTGSKLSGETEHGGRIMTFDFANVSVMSFTLFWEYAKWYDFYSSNKTFDAAYQRPAVSVQWAAEQAFEYYFTKHNRNSYDNLGSPIRSFVHIDQNMNNAFWTSNRLGFGDGSFNNPLVGLDVVGHELTHGVTQYEANLNYYLESGALSESFSDIMGKAIDFHTFGDSAVWELAKEYQPGGLRDFRQPNLKNQPDTYNGTLWYTGSEDSGGVHYNSGVQNFWFYLLCEGGAGINDHGVSYSVNSIGMDNATKIAYRNLTEYLINTSDYLDSRIGSMLATADLYGKNSATYTEVDHAWDAVGVIDEPIITSMKLYDITATTVKVQGTLLPRGKSVTYRFEYGTTPAMTQSTLSYNYKDKVEGIITGLQPGTKYFLRLVATNENGSTYYTTTEFTTISPAPLAKIMATVDVTESTARLYGQINPNSLSTSFYFEYGPTPSLGSVTPSYPLSDTTEYVGVSATVTNLTPRQTYYYKLRATNEFSSVVTEALGFYTSVKPEINLIAPTSAAIDAEVTITGKNFNHSVKQNLVHFGATRATVVSANATQLVVKVPRGASFGPVTVTDGESGLVGQSAGDFVPTFSGEFKKNSLQLAIASTDLIYQAIVQDMDGDSKPDIVARHYLGFSVFQNVHQSGDITNESFVRNTTSLESSMSTFGLADFDGNGLKDIVGMYRSSLRIYPNFSTPGFISFGPPIDLPTTMFLSNVTLRDFDLDGHVDIAANTVYALDSTVVTVFRNQNPKGTLTADNFVKSYRSVPYYVQFMTCSDLNNDGRDDLMLSCYNEKFLVVLKNNSSPGKFMFEEAFVQDANRGRYVRYLASDLNQDGWKDLTAISSVESNKMSLLENSGLPAGIIYKNPITALNDQQGYIQPGDIDGDGKVDLIVGTSQRKFFLYKNKGTPKSSLSGSSFEKWDDYGMPLVNAGSGTVETQTSVNDLNGDGRPEIINCYGYNFGPHDGYQMEIWQNAPNNCFDPSLVKVIVSSYTGTIVLPEGSTFDQFQIEVASSANPSYWQLLTQSTFSVQYNSSYQLRIRAKCLAGFTDYAYLSFVTDCVNTSGFRVIDVTFNSANLATGFLTSIEVQYSPAGKGEWRTLPQSANQMTGLLSGTTYDVRFRGRCSKPVEFSYIQFTTLCSELASLTISDISYNKAVVSWTKSNSGGNTVADYSKDNVSWTPIDATRTIAGLTPGTQYYVRARNECTNFTSRYMTTAFTTTCPKATLLTIEAITPFSAKVVWTDESKTGSYTLKYGLTSSSLVTTVHTSTPYITLTNLTPGTQYAIYVSPKCVATEDVTSATFSTICHVPFNLMADAITYTSAEISWDDHFVWLPYTVEYAVAGSSVWKITEVSSKNLVLSQLRPGTEYEVRVHITCVSVKAPYVSLHFNTALYDETIIAPNPTDSKVTIYPSKDVFGNHFVIYDNVGRTIVEGELMDYTLDLSDLPLGLYILKIEGEKSLRIFKR